MKALLKKYLLDILVIGISVLFSLAVFAVYPLLNSFYINTHDKEQEHRNTSKAVIEVNGERFGIFDLNTNQTIEVKTDYGMNIVEIKDGRAYVSDADCPDRLCVGQNGDFLKEIICLPNRMVLRMDSFDSNAVDDEEEYDAIAY